MGLFSIPGLSDAAGPNPLVTSFPAVDTFTIVGLKMPGKWTLLDAPKVFGWQIQQGFGLSGATVFPIADELVVAKFRGEMWESPDYEVYKQIRKNILVKPVFSVGGALIAGALGIDHPELAALGVKAVVLKEIRPTIQEEGGLWVAHVDFLQYRPPLPIAKKPTFVVPDTGPGTIGPPTRYASERDGLTSQIDSQKAALAAKK